MQPIIQSISALEILDSRGNPTVEATVILENQVCGKASVPSGASTGKFEAHERRDGDKDRYGGKGVLDAVAAIHNEIAPALIGQCADEQTALDRLLCRLDGTENKAHVGANATLAVSLAMARASANFYHLPLYRYLGGVCGTRLPVPMMNILNGGAHAANNLDIQEFMIVPVGAPSFAEGLRWGAEIYHTLGRLLRSRGLATAVGDEGGFAPHFESDEAALEAVHESICEAGLAGLVKISLDVAASEWWQDGAYHLPKRGICYHAEELISYYRGLSERYPLLSIEDGLGEEDTAGWQAMTKVLGQDLTLVGDDLFVTNEARFLDGVREKTGNAILIKPNQIGTLSEALAVIRAAKSAGFAHILSHRSGETEDTFIADLAVATNAPFIKAGAPCRGERVAKYNRLLEIEQALGSAHPSGASFAFHLSPAKAL